MKKAWNFLTKTVGTIVILGTCALGILFVVDELTKSKTIRDIYDNNDDEYDFDFDVSDLD